MKEIAPIVYSNYYQGMLFNANEGVCCFHVPMNLTLCWCFVCGNSLLFCVCSYLRSGNFLKFFCEQSKQFGARRTKIYFLCLQVDQASPRALPQVREHQFSHIICLDHNQILWTSCRPRYSTSHRTNFSSKRRQQELIIFHFPTRVIRFKCKIRFSWLLAGRHSSSFINSSRVFPI